MSFFHRILTGSCNTVSPNSLGRETRRSSPRSLSPRLETLETIELLSHGGLSPASLARLKPVAQVQSQDLPFFDQTALKQVSASSISQKALTGTQTSTVPTP